jgi:hypothetical protein
MKHKKIDNQNDEPRELQKPAPRFDPSKGL